MLTAPQEVFGKCVTVVLVAFMLDGVLGIQGSGVRDGGAPQTQDSPTQERSRLYPARLGTSPLDFHLNGRPIGNNLNQDPNSVLQESEACRAFKTVWPWGLRQPH